MAATVETDLLEELAGALQQYRAQLIQLNEVDDPQADTLQLKAQVQEAIVLTEAALKEAAQAGSQDPMEHNQEQQPVAHKAQHHAHKRAASVSLDAREQEPEAAEHPGIHGGPFDPLEMGLGRAGQADSHVLDQVQAIRQLSIDQHAPTALSGPLSASLPSSEHAFTVLPQQAGPQPFPFQPGLLNIPRHDSAEGAADLDQDGDMDSQAGYIPPPSLSDTDSQLFSDSPHSFSHGPRSFIPNSIPSSPAASGPPSAGRVGMVPQSWGGVRTVATASPFTAAGQQPPPSLDSLPVSSPHSNGALGTSPYLFPDERLEEMEETGEEVQGGQEGRQEGDVVQAPQRNASGRTGPGPWSAWWNANKDRPAAAYGGSISAWLSGMGPGMSRQPSDDVASLRSERSSTDGSCVEQVVGPHRADGTSLTPRSYSRSSSWSFDSAEQLAIAAAEAAAEAADDSMVGEFDTGVGATAAAVRAAARRAKAAQHGMARLKMQGGALSGVGVSQQGPGGGGGGGGAPDIVARVQGVSHVMEEAGGDAGSREQLQGLEAVQGEAAWVSEAPTGRQGRNNPRMHINNRYYLQEPDFIALSRQYPDLKPYLTLPSHPGGKAVFDFTSWEATRQLTATLLQADFGVRWWLPDGQLVPTITNRCNYLHWVQDLLNLSRPPGQISGLDVGCGANFIYCLLGAAGFDWQMVGVDVTDVAITWAVHNMESNPHLQHLLEVRRSTDRAHSHEAQEAVEVGGVEEADPGGVLIPAFKSDTETFTFTMCNPPFFNSIEEANGNPATACGGTPAEMVYPGGELAFIMRMIEDSVRLGSRVHWYSTMVGKKVTLKALRKELHMRHVTAIRTTELAQGKTSRWAIAWSFDVDRNLANVPLPRTGAAPTAAALPSPKKSISFSLKSGKVDARGVLQLLSSLLTAQGATCSIDAAQWRVTAVLPPPTSQSGSAADVAEAALLAEISRDQRHADTSAGGMMQAAKKARGPPVAAAQQVSDALASSGAQALSIRISVFQQHRGQFEFTASIPNSSSTEEATRFTQLLTKVHGDLDAISS